MIHRGGEASRLFKRELQDQPGFVRSAELHLPAEQGRRPATPRHDSHQPNRTYIEKAYDCAKYGYISERPVIEATIPSSLDGTVAPEGKHVMSMFTQYFPYKLAADAGTLEETRNVTPSAASNHDGVRRGTFAGR